MTLITSQIKTKIQQILSVVETGSTNAKYSIIAILKDGRGGSRQITYGKHQTTEQGNLGKLLEMYASNKNAKYGAEIKAYLPKVGVTPLADDQPFIALLRAAGDDLVMQQSQDTFFDTLYWQPAQKFFAQNAFTQPLSMLVIYDSYIHSGSVLSSLRAQFTEPVPAAGGSEQAWITHYLNARHSWLANHPNAIVQRTTYRTRAMIIAAQEGNWLLEKEYKVNGHVIK